MFYGEMIRKGAPIPVFKYCNEAIDYVRRGFVDFVAIVDYWIPCEYTTPPLVYRQITGWGNAYKDIGYEVWAKDLETLKGMINYLVTVNRGRYEFIYFVCHVPTIIQKHNMVKRYLSNIGRGEDI